MSNKEELFKSLGIDLTEGQSVEDYLFEHSEDFISKVGTLVSTERESGRLLGRSEVEVELSKASEELKSTSEVLKSTTESLSKSEESHKGLGLRVEELEKRISELSVTSRAQETESAGDVESGVRQMFGEGSTVAERLKNHTKALRS